MHSIVDFDLAKRLPGSVTVIETSSRSAQEIIQLIIEKTPTTDFVILQNADVWRNRTNPQLLNFLQNYNSKTVFIITTSGIDYLKIADNILELPLPDEIENWWGQAPMFKHSCKKYGYSCINNRQSWHRLSLGYQLWKSGLLDRIIYSQNLLPDATAAKLDGPLFGYEQVLFDSLDDSKTFLSMLPVTWCEERKDFADDHTILHDAFNLSYANIAAESETEFFGHDRTYPTPTISEKTYKPFLSGQIGVLLAAQGVIGFLEDHGFYMFRELTSNDYDHLNTKDKINKIVDLVSAGTDPVADLYSKSKDMLEHNFIHLTQGHYTKSVLDRAISFVNLNCK
jgi:hypothetical protein